MAEPRSGHGDAGVARMELDRLDTGRDPDAQQGLRGLVDGGGAPIWTRRPFA
ncbi:hypothetical protein [Aureimonas sp. Leaf454]|uniref:hypothetical protein n=1 Tax=Aureimonas sp. Leaf454 TaxID=1736381 RepID=UPI00138F3475|nr:hypothetical protein [Aureimonas sp. Leaf454]